MANGNIFSFYWGRFDKHCFLVACKMFGLRGADDLSPSLAMLRLELARRFAPAKDSPHLHIYVHLMNT